MAIQWVPSKAHKDEAIKSCSSWDADERFSPATTTATEESESTMMGDSSTSFYSVAESSFASIEGECSILDEDDAPYIEPKGSKTGNDALDTVLSELRGISDTNSIRMATQWNELGLIRLHMQNNPLEAIKCFHQALQILCIESNRADGKIDLAITLSDISLCYSRLDKTVDARRTINKACAIFDEQNVKQDNIHYKSALRLKSQLSSQDCYSPSYALLREKRLKHSTSFSMEMPKTYI